MDQRTRDLLREVRALELVARRNVSSALDGNYRTTIIGRGLDFHEARRYVQGESVRLIDWKITARLGEPHVKTFVEERQREVMIALDVSPSMFTGWQALSKIEAAVELAATLAVSAESAGDRVGFVTFADRALAVAPPLAGKKHLFRTLTAFVRALENPREPCEISDPRQAFHAIQAWRGRRFVVFVISDFIDHDVPQDLAYLGRRHDVSLLHIFDPFEYAYANSIRLNIRSPEGSRAPTTLKPGDMGRLDERVGLLQQEAARHRVAMASFPTNLPLGPALARFFKRRRGEAKR